MRFDITKKVDLSYLGETWKECYLEFNLPSYGDLKDLTNEKATDAEKVEKGLETITGLFRGGFAISGGEKIIVSKEDLKDIPVEILTKCFKVISGEIDPK
jgi:hypothetical protein